jgi:hypothetical protein
VDEPCRLLQAVGASLNGGSLESSLKGHEDLQVGAERIIVMSMG